MKPASNACLLAPLLLAVACGTGRKGSAGFHVPDGDVAKGHTVFVSLRCYSCHSVPGADVPAPTAPAESVIAIGGQVPVPRTDGEIVAAIIDPSHRLTAGTGGAVASHGGLSRMGDFGESMTVRELVDLTAFVQSRYEVVNTTYPHQ
jgi:hypothetical protein